MNKENFLPLLAIILTAVLWGISFLSIKISVAVLPPMTLAFIRFAIASVLLITILKWREPNTKLEKKDYKLMILAGVIGVTLYFYFENNGVKLTTASVASIVIGTIPIFSLIADAIIFRNPLNTVKIISVLLSIFGVAFVVNANGRQINTGFGLGYLMMFGAALAWVAYSIFTKPLFQKYTQLTIVTYQTLFGTLALLPFALFENTSWQLVTTRVIFHVIYLAVFCSALGYYLYAYAMDHLGISITSLYINLIPVVTVAASYLWLDEKISLTQILGGLLVLISVYLANRPSDRSGEIEVGA